MTPRKQLLLIFAIFLLPLGAAMLWYGFLPGNYKPGSTTNHGKLIQPPYTVQPFTQQTLAGDVYTPKQLEQVWTLVHVIDGPCDAACSRALYDTRQIRIALGKDIDRVKRIAIVDPVAAGDQKMWASHPDMTVLKGTVNGLGAQIRARAAAFAFPENSVYLIDPLGNLMMQFGPDIDPKLLMQDLQKLLRLSHIG